MSRDKTRKRLFRERVSSMKVQNIIVFLAVASSAFGQSGTIAGSVVDPTGATIAQARVKLRLDGRAPDRESQSTETGEYSFSNVPLGPFRVSFNAKGFAPQIVTGELRDGETLALPKTILAVETVNSGVTVSENVEAIAEAQIKLAETQRFAGLVPNYFVNYNPDAAPLNARQKFQLTWRTFLDPSSFAITGIIAGVQQARNTHKGFGQGGQGYAKRYGAAYGDFVTSVMLDRVVMPTIFHQDPRYFYKGTGSTKSRAGYALSRTFICQGDNKKAQFCYSRLISNFGSGFATNYLYPKADRNTNGQILQDSAIGIGAEALANLFQEFIAKKITKRKQ